jgi:hypothetical protein
MALHRDIFWVGRQWAVTGHGIQAVDQRLRGALDIEIARLWDDDLVTSRRAKPGLNAEDFDKALTMARTRWPQSAAPAPAASPSIPPGFAAGLQPELSRALDRQAAAPAAAPARPAMRLRAEGRLARFLPLWRIRR